MTQFSLLLPFQFPVIICLTLAAHRIIHHDRDLVAKQTSSGKFIFPSATKKQHGDNCKCDDEERALVAVWGGPHPWEAVFQSNLSAVLCKLPWEKTSSLPTGPRIAPSAALCLLALNSCFCYIYTDQGGIKQQEQPNFFPIDPISSSLGTMWVMLENT